MIKKVIIALMLVALSLGASAQFRWGVTAGANFTDYNFKQKLVDVKSSAGAEGGIVGELMFPGIGFGVDFGLNYNFHGAKVNLGQQKVWASEGYGDEQIRIHSLEIPLHLRFKYTNLNGLERTIAPFVFAGPIFSFHLADNNVKAMEYPAGSVMIQFGLGAELRERFQIFGTYNLGVTYEMRTVKLENFSARRSSFDVGVAYFFK